MNLHECTNQFKSRMLEDAGIDCDSEIIADGNLHRVHIRGDKQSTKNAAYIFHFDDNPTGFYQNHKTGISGTWNATSKKTKLSKADINAIKHAKQKRQQALKLKHNKSAISARYLWGKFTPVVSHDYLTKKHIKSHRSRIDRSNKLVIPLFNTQLKLVNLQFISKIGEKRFLSGGQKKGCFWWIGKPTSSIIIAEGFSTAATLHEQTGDMVFIAFDAGNLKPVALNVKKFYPDNHLVIAGDNDLSGVGQDKAREAALAVSALVSMPPTKGHDWNDHYNCQQVIK